MRKLRNNTGNDVEFVYVGLSFVVPAGQTVAFDDTVVKHYLGYVNGPLEEVREVDVVKIANTTSEDKTFNGVTIKANSEMELPKVEAKAFIRSVDGVWWATPDEGKKKETPETAKSVEETPKVGERGDI